jgi:hypothetical protein
LSSFFIRSPWRLCHEHGDITMGGALRLQFADHWGLGDARDDAKKVGSFCRSLGKIFVVLK